MENKSEINSNIKMKPLPPLEAILISCVVGCVLLLFFVFGGDVKFREIVIFIVLSIIGGIFCAFISYNTPKYWYIIGLSIGIPSALLYFSLFFSDKPFPSLLFIFPSMFLISGFLGALVGKILNHITNQST